MSGKVLKAWEVYQTPYKKGGKKMKLPPHFANLQSGPLPMLSLHSSSMAAPPLPSPCRVALSPLPCCHRCLFSFRRPSLHLLAMVGEATAAWQWGAATRWRQWKCGHGKGERREQGQRPALQIYKVGGGNFIFLPFFCKMFGKPDPIEQLKMSWVDLISCLKLSLSYSIMFIWCTWD